MSIAERRFRTLGRVKSGQWGVPLDLPQPESHVPPPKLVELCYTLTDSVQAVGITDLADGEFRPTDRCLEQGIDRQLNYLLDQVGCTRPGFRLLDIGCGYGRLLEIARDRGARPVGITVSHEQFDYCKRRGLQVYLCNYCDLLDAREWHGQFDGIVANGSLEHWVQPQDAEAGRMDEIYHESFEIADKLLDPKNRNARYVTTAIHAKRDVRPEYLLESWHHMPRGCDRRHYSLLYHWMGGYYPAIGQLAECAKPYFTLEHEMDGTLGYRRANIYRMDRLRRGLHTSPRLIWRILRTLVRHPRVTGTMLESYFVEHSWDWQFQGCDPPMKLLRQTWKRAS